MAYQANKPLAADQISISQGDLQGNFQEVNSAWNTNHVPFNLGDEGKHWFIHIPDMIPSGVLPPATNGGEIGLYSVAGNLWFRPSGQGIGDTTNDINITDTSGNIALGWYKFPNGLIMKWAKSGLLNIGQNYSLALAATPVITTVLAVSLTAGPGDDTGATMTYQLFSVAQQRVSYHYHKVNHNNSTCICLIVGV